MTDSNNHAAALETAWRAAATQGGESLWDIADSGRGLVVLLRHLG